MEGPPLQEGIGWDGVGARGSLCPSPLRPLSSRARPTLCPASGLGPPARGSRLHASTSPSLSTPPLMPELPSVRPKGLLLSLPPVLARQRLPPSWGLGGPSTQRPL